ncbi:ABC transporter permease [Ruminococcus sp.]
MKTLAFASRNAKELQRDVLTSIFGIAFPIVLLVLLSVINSSIPKEAHMTLFEIKNLTGGISAFGLVFLSLFSALLVSKDRCTAFIIRLYASPLKPSGYILGYTVPLIPMALLQTLVTC